MLSAVDGNGEKTLERVLEGAAHLALDRPEISRIITTLIANAEANVKEGETRLAAARRNVEQWFDDTMDRAAGWYKRRAQAMLFSAGLVIAVILNIDTVTIATTLWRDPTLRQTVVAQAEQYQLPAITEDTTAPDLDQAAASIRDLSTKLSQDLRLPIGWRIEAGQILEVVPGSSGLLGKIVGWLITALAITQGAPFWFDLLQKLVNLRSAGNKPEKTT